MPRQYIPKTDKRLSDETKAKIAAKVRERNGTPEARAAISENLKAYHARVAAALALLDEQEANNG
ncbi:hypothetical protein NG701_20245 [Pseudarthrobacter sp. HLT3-5]|uniref:hypothetical protein n=1 Tax=Pseudarthrobacter cellobiosi TaxID=2953654 RepID=UPI00208E63C8|nr:hypothetical protein [Pseudarthrobacter sp. HLT3-5]MCO4276717.1 hypothetical protein [Pseudarthrobacter sp. HLT3-5]